MSEETAAATELAPAHAVGLIEAGAELIDVRRPYEFAGGPLAGARNIEMNDLAAAADELPRDRLVIFYCRSGNRSSMAVAAFAEAGFDVYARGPLKARPIGLRAASTITASGIGGGSLVWK